MATHHTQHDHKDGKWSAEVTEHSDAMDLEEGVFESDDPKDELRKAFGREDWLAAGTGRTIFRSKRRE